MTAEDILTNGRLVIQSQINGAFLDLMMKLFFRWLMDNSGFKRATNTGIIMLIDHG